MKRYKVLITGTGGCGVGEGLYKALLNMPEYILYSCNSSNNSLFLFNNISRSFIVPSANDPGYCKIIHNICIENNINIIIPGSEPELLTLATNREIFEKDKILVLANTEDVIKTFNNKWETFKRLRSFGIKTPDTTDKCEDELFFERNKYPLVIKPVIGNASKNVFFIHCKEELLCISEYLKIKRIPFIIQEYIGTIEEEYTISVITDFDGNYIGSIILKRHLSAGFSQFIICEEFSELNKIAIEIAMKLNSRGPINIQCRFSNNELFVFEVNPRFSGTTPFRAMLGFNEPDILIKKIYEGVSLFDPASIKFKSFGVRGFTEEIYPSYLMSKIYHCK